MASTKNLVHPLSTRSASKVCCYRQVFEMWLSKKGD
uniref:Uncharacterized protein n=1 Tax=Solanum lycopersicum TaxID=4081 RepID=A0A3Q7GV20_SOLLC